MSSFFHFFDLMLIEAHSFFDIKKFLNFQGHVPYHFYMRPMLVMDGPPGMAAPTSAVLNDRIPQVAFASYSPGHISPPPPITIRKEFPESWIWEELKE